MNIHSRLSGEYKLVITKPDGTKTETEWFDNLILNSGLNFLGSGSAPIRFCRLGSGVSNPTETQTNLDSPLATSNDGSGQAISAVNQGAPTYASILTFGWTFAQGTVIGNVSEIGVGWTNSNGGLFSRALVTDINGNPISITIIAIDQLTVYYRLKIIPNLADTYGSFQVNGITYTYDARICNAANFASSYLMLYQTWHQPSRISFYNNSPTPPTLAAVTASGPNGVAGSSWDVYNDSAFGSAGNYAYVQDTYYIDSSWSFGIQRGNASGGIRGFRFGWGNVYGSAIQYQVILNQPIPKDATKTFNINTRLSWSR